jgi:hypothetical protein
LEASGFSQYFQDPFRHFLTFWAIEIAREFILSERRLRAPHERLASRHCD